MTTAAVIPPGARKALAELRTMARQRPDWPYLVPVPSCEPPFDDERTAADRLRAARGGVAERARRATVATPPVVMPAGRQQVGRQPDLRDVDAAPSAGRALRSVPGRRGPVDVERPGAVSSPVPTWSDDPDVGIRRTPSRRLPPAQRAAVMLSRGLVEVLTGVRHPDQLRGFCSPPVFAGLEDLPLIPGTGLPKIRSVRVSSPADGAAEVCVVFQRGPRVRALAFRIEGVDGRWRMTALQVA